MRTPVWESSAGALAAFLNGTQQCYMADLYTLTARDGTVLARYTSADIAISVGGYAYQIGPVITRGKTKLTVGVSVDQLDVTIAADATVTINGVGIIPFIAAGGLDEARLTLYRVFAAAPPVWNVDPAWIGLLSMFAGRVSDASVSRYEAKLTVVSDSELLNVMVPRNVYQPGCGNTLFDGSCGLAKTTWAVTGTATSVTDAARTTFSTGLAQAADYFALGWAVGLTGPNAGVGRTVKAFASGTITVIQPWPFAVAIGNTFKVYPGCDKKQATCSGKFSNLTRFRGHPYVPSPETVL